MKEIHSIRYGKRAESILAPAEGHSASISMCAPTGRSLNPILWGFYGGFFT